MVESAKCPTCSQSTPGGGECSRCRARREWNEYAGSVVFCISKAKLWCEEGLITGSQYATIQAEWEKLRVDAVASAERPEAMGFSPAMPPIDQCWHCHQPIRVQSEFCEECLAPLHDERATELRRWQFLAEEIRRLEDHGILKLRQCDELQDEIESRIRAIKRQLKRDRPASVRLAEINEPARPLLERLADPKTIQMLLGLGAGLLVLGLVLWLASLGLFERPEIVAGILGAGTAALWAGGFLLIRLGKHEHAGRALMLLSCLIMPLNLWFYHRYEILSLHGHLWVAGLAFCGVYAISAFLVRDETFVWVLMIGFTLSGLLILADLNRIAEVFAPATLMIGVGIAAMLSERIFPTGDGPFTRGRFGLAFFWSGLAVLSSGLLFLLGGHLVGWLHQPIFQQLGIARPVIVDREYVPWVLGLLLVSAAVFIYADLVVRRIGVYLYLAAICLLWAEFQFLHYMEWADAYIVIGTLALTCLGAQVLEQGSTVGRRVLMPLVVLLTVLPLIIASVVHLRAVLPEVNRVWPTEITWQLMGSMAVLAGVCRTGAHLYRHRSVEVVLFFFLATALATLIGAAQILWLIGLRTWLSTAPILMVVPVLYLIASSLQKGSTIDLPLFTAGHVSTVAMGLLTLGSAMGLAANNGAGLDQNPRLLIMAFCLVAALFYALNVALRNIGWLAYPAAVLLCAAAWEGCRHWDLPPEAFTIAVTSAGVALLAGHKLAFLESVHGNRTARAASRAAMAITMTGIVVGSISTMGRILREHAAIGVHPVSPWQSLALCGFMAAAAVAAAWMCRASDWRYAFIAAGVAQALLAILLLHEILHLKPWRLLEIVSVAFGVVLLVAGHIGWRREGDDPKDSVSFALMSGSFLTIVPLAMVVIGQRITTGISWGDEVAFIVGSLSLLTGGIVLHLRATTLVGGSGLALYIVIILISLHRWFHEMATVGLYLAIGGAAVFGVGIILSLYRDRILHLSKTYRRREGVFQVLAWR